jgi:hypothetical protein
MLAVPVKPGLRAEPNLFIDSLPKIARLPALNPAEPNLFRFGILPTEPWKNRVFGLTLTNAWL